MCTLGQNEVVLKQEAQGPWPSAWHFATWNQDWRFMPNGNVAGVIYLQRAVNRLNLADSKKK